MGLVWGEIQIGAVRSTVWENKGNAPVASRTGNRRENDQKWKVFMAD